MGSGGGGGSREIMQEKLTLVAKMFGLLRAARTPPTTYDLRPTTYEDQKRSIIPIPANTFRCHLEVT